MPFDPNIILSATNTKPIDPIQNYLRLAQLRGYKNEDQLSALHLQEQQMRISELTRQQNQQSQIQNAARQAVVPAQEGGQSQFDPNRFASSLDQIDPLQAQAFRSQQAQQKIVSEEQLLKLSAAKRAEAAAQLDRSVKGFYMVESLPEALRPDAYKRELQNQLQDKTIHASQIGTTLPAEYPGSQGMQAILMQADSVANILKRIQEQQDAIPLSPEAAKVAGKAPGARVPIATANTLDQMANRGNESPDAQSLKAWLAKNPGKDASDYTVWKAKNSPTMMMNNQLQLSPEAQALAARLYLESGGQLPGGFTRSPQVTAGVINQAAKANPDANLAENKVAFGAKQGMAKYMTSGKGGQQLTAFNTAIVHLNTLDRLADDLNNTDIRVVNRAKQAWAEQTGSPAPANFQAAVNAMSGEVAAALKASGATDQEIEKAASTFSRAQSPAQIKGAINTYRELLKGKAGQLKGQYEQGVQGKPNFGSEGQQNADPLGIR